MVWKYAVPLPRKSDARTVYTPRRAGYGRTGKPGRRGESAACEPGDDPNKNRETFIKAPSAQNVNNPRAASRLVGMRSNRCTAD